MNVKTCLKCKIAQDVAQFTIRRSNPDGLKRWCRSCIKQSKVQQILANKSRSIEEQFPSGTKTCSRCSQDMVLSQFTKANGTLFSWCKNCAKEQWRQRKRLRESRSEDELNEDRRKRLKVNEDGVFVKTCSVCQKSKLTKDFGNSKASFDALSSQCKTCDVARTSKTYQEVKTLRAELKEGKKCENCAISDPDVLDFAHLDRKDKFRNSKGRPVNLSSMQSKSKILMEVTKTKMLCKYCHRLETKQENDAKSKNRTKPGVRKKQEFVNQIKVNIGCCQDCKIQVSGQNTVAFDFDHLDATTKVTEVSQMTKCTLDEIQAEIDKCELVCSNCHQKRTNRRLQAAKLQATLSAQESALLSQGRDSSAR